jgi:hypothetical protein
LNDHAEISPAERARQSTILLGACALGASLMMGLVAGILQAVPVGDTKDAAIIFGSVSGLCMLGGLVVLGCGVAMQTSRNWASVLAVVVLSFQSIGCTVAAVVGIQSGIWLIVAVLGTLAIVTLFVLVRLGVSLCERPETAPRGFAPILPPEKI